MQCYSVESSGMHFQIKNPLTSCYIFHLSKRKILLHVCKMHFLPHSKHSVRVFCYFYYTGPWSETSTILDCNSYICAPQPPPTYTPSPDPFSSLFFLTCISIIPAPGSQEGSHIPSKLMEYFSAFARFVLDIQDFYQGSRKIYLYLAYSKS